MKITYFAKVFRLFNTAILFTALVPLCYAQTVVSGRIRDEKGVPMPAVNVLLLHVSDSSLVRGSVTDDIGTFSIRKVSPGSYLLIKYLRQAWITGACGMSR